MANIDTLIDRFINGSRSESQESFQELLNIDWWAIAPEILALLLAKDWAARELATESIAASIVFVEPMSVKQAADCLRPTATLLGQAYGSNWEIEPWEGSIRQLLWGMLMRFLSALPEDELASLDQATIESLAAAVREAENTDSRANARMTAKRLGRYHESLADAITENFTNEIHQSQFKIQKLRLQVFETLGDIGPNSIGQIESLVVSLLENAEDACMNLSIPLTAEPRIWSAIEAFRRASPQLSDGVPLTAVYPDGCPDEWFILPVNYDGYFVSCPDFELSPETAICCVCGAALQKIDPTGIGFARACQRLFKTRHVRWRPLALLTTIPLLNLSWGDSSQMLKTEIKRFLSYNYEHYPELICGWIREADLTKSQRLQLLVYMLDVNPDEPQLLSLMQEFVTLQDIEAEELSQIAAKLGVWLKSFRAMPEDSAFYFQNACENGLLESNMPVGFAQVLVDHKSIRNLRFCCGRKFDELLTKAQKRIDQGSGLC